MTNAPSDPAPRVVDADWADRAPIALGVIRDSVLVYVNERMADLLGGTTSPTRIANASASDTRAECAASVSRTRMSSR